MTQPASLGLRECMGRQGICGSAKPCAKQRLECSPDVSELIAVLRHHPATALGGVDGESADGGRNGRRYLRAGGWSVSFVSFEVRVALSRPVASSSWRAASQ